MLCTANSLEADIGGSYAPSVSFGANLKRLRLQRQLKAKDVAKGLGIKQGSYSDYERDRRGLPEGPTLLKFAKYYAVTIDELVRGVDADYDRLVVELDGVGFRPTAEKNFDALTPPVSPPEVLDRLYYSPLGGRAHADAASGGGTADRLSEPTTANDAEVQQLLGLENLYDLLGQLDRSASTIRIVSDALRARLATGSPGTDATERDGRSANVRRPKARRGARQ
jgi:transcriptional regulator with XRE-family HTH domain